MWFPHLKKKKNWNLTHACKQEVLVKVSCAANPRGSEPQHSLFGQTPVAPSQTPLPASLPHAVTLGGHIVGGFPGTRRRHIPAMAIGSAGAGTSNRPSPALPHPIHTNNPKTGTYVMQHQRGVRE